MNAVCVVSMESSSRLARLNEIMEENMRPDFEDELQSAEHGLMELIEQLPVPESSEVISETIALYEFGEDDAFAAMNMLPTFLAGFGCAAAVAVQLGYGEEQYHVLDESFFQFIYSPKPLEDEEDEKEFNRKLNSAQLAEFKQARQQGITQACLYFMEL